MKKRPLITVHLIVISVLFILLATSCKKDEGGNPETVTDIDGNVYKTVTIGSQVWMKENLRTIRYRNGDLIGTTTPADKDIWGELEAKYQWAAGGNENNVPVYGRLYTWTVVDDSRGICPTGWHVPDKDEWNTLIMFAGGWDLAGGRLKEKGTSHWESPNTDGDDRYGFAALPGGGRWPLGFNSLGNKGYYWTTSIIMSTYAMVTFSSDSGVAEFDAHEKFIGFSVRCLKD